MIFVLSKIRCNLTAMDSNTGHGPGRLLGSCGKAGLEVGSEATMHPLSLRDHAGGNEKLVKLVPGLKVYGGDERVGALTNRATHLSTLQVRCRGWGGVWAGMGMPAGSHTHCALQVGSLHVKCLATPCHTSGHICYFVSKPGTSKPPAVFTGERLPMQGLISAPTVSSL